MSDWIESLSSAWKGHRNFAEWLVTQYQHPSIVELGVDYGYSTFVFANALMNNQSSGKIYGIDLFQGDDHAGFRDTYSDVIKNIEVNKLSNIEIIKGEFTDQSMKWKTPIDILHIDGLHTYEAVKNDFTNWSKYVKSDGIVIFHDVCIPYFTVNKFFRELGNGYKLYFTHSAGLGIWTKNKELRDNILKSFDNVINYEIKSL